MATVNVLVLVSLLYVAFLFAVAFGRTGQPGKGGVGG